MKNVKQFVAIIIIAILVITNVPSYAEILTNFDKINSYDDNTYSDVSINDWYYYYVGFAYEYGIMTGTAQSIFSPNGSITLAEAVTVATRLNASYYGNLINTKTVSDLNITPDREIKYSYPVSGDANITVLDYNNSNSTAKTGHYVKNEGLGTVTQTSSNLNWFIPYLSYAIDQEIISAGQFNGLFEHPATREQLAYLLYRALPSCYTKINDITPIPDVNSSNPYYKEILSLYEAGVVTGNDEYGTFYAQTNIQRSEAAAMVSRTVNSDLRVHFSLNTNIPYKLLTYSWNYPYYGNTFTLSMDISYYDYNYFLSKPRSYDYTVYAADEADVTGLTHLAEALKNLAIENGFTSDYDIASFISSFVQYLPYMDDYEYKKIVEYPKYPIETLFDQGGDCEDSAVLLAKLLKLLGYGTVLLVSDDHMAVGLQTSGNGNISYNGINYYYIETTEPGWRVGQVPGDMMGKYLSVLYI